ncbi:MAG: HRDC domain-containing protein, partial [Chloroflexota bacterium]|nr:HRDC domain-containing protein [Chloroflexota bacterium]
IRALWSAELGYDDDAVAGHAGDESRERTAALDTLLDILSTQVRSDASVDSRSYLAELDRRRAAEHAGSADGVNLLTYHRAKGLEWDAVALPAVEEGLLPIRQAVDDDDLLAEELRLLYVGITRARRHLAISWAAERETRGRTTRRQPSRFLADLRPRGAQRVTQLPDRFAALQGQRRTASAAAAANPYGMADDDPLFAALRAWRTERAREEGVPPYIVFHDQTLAAIADVKPPSAAALRRVKGIGPAKVEAYGDDILELVARLR